MTKSVDTHGLGRSRCFMDHAKVNRVIVAKDLELCRYAGCLLASCATTLTRFVRIRGLTCLPAPITGRPVGMSPQRDPCTVRSHVLLVGE
jgi:hypothetical protein